MRVSLLLFCIFSLFSSLSRGSSIPFSPIVMSYSVSDYNAGIQNWSIAQDDRGVMYIGNNKGLLEFDGNSWELHELPSRNIVRSVKTARYLWDLSKSSDISNVIHWIALCTTL